LSLSPFAVNKIFYIIAHMCYNCNIKDCSTINHGMTLRKKTKEKFNAPAKQHVGQEGADKKLNADKTQILEIKGMKELEM